jgi:hypothetical protein
MTLRKIERFHRSMKNEVCFQHYYLPGELEQETGRFIEYHNNQRYHESLENVTPADAYFGRHNEVITTREEFDRTPVVVPRGILVHFGLGHCGRGGTFLPSISSNMATLPANLVA